MKDYRFRLILILLFVALSVYLLYPTVIDYFNTKKIDETLVEIEKDVKASNPNISRDALNNLLSVKKDSIIASDESIRNARAKRLKLGLDLQGGMYVVMEVNTAKLMEKLAKDPDKNFTAALAEAEKEAALSDEDVVTILTRKLQDKGIRLSRYFGNIREDDNQIIKSLKQQSDDAVTRAMQIIRNRVDQYGVSEPSITKQGDRRIVVELPGVAKEEEAKQLLQGRALLEFKLVKDAEFTVPVMQRIDEVLAGTNFADSLDTAKTSQTAKSEQINPEPTDTNQQDLTPEQFAKQHPFFSLAMIDPRNPYADAYVRADKRDQVKMMLDRPEVQNVMPNNVQFLFSADPIAKADDGVDIYRLYLVNKQAELTGGVIVDAQSNIDQQTGQAIVNMQMNSEGAREWARITGSNVNKRCAIVLDDVIYSAPNINEKIPNGSSQISGMAGIDEAKLLEIVLKAGALPAPIDIMEERTVGPSLGQDSVAAGLNSSVLGFIVVALFMIIYYKRAGSIASVGLFFTVLLVMAVLAGFSATLSLPGIAGIILTMGMAVDSNVLIYERMREELATGKTMKAAVDAGFAQSFSAIIDSNLTTFITGLVLYQFGGSGPVQGFALTLMIGIIASLFGSLVVTRVIFDMLVNKNSDISIG
jgi:preprotein translocase subunit SecD